MIMRLCQYWYIVCFINAWIISEADNPRKIEDDNRDVSTTECGEESHFMLNKCEERCECKNGKLTSCHRVRKEFTKMTIEHRKRYINAYKLASVHPLFKKNYEKTVALHLNESDEARLPEVFLPCWYRWYLTEFENLLRRIDCRVTIPFWDWSKNTHHWWKTFGILGITVWEEMEVSLITTAWRTDLSAKISGVSWMCPEEGV